MKKKFYLLLLPFFILAATAISAFSAPNVKLTTSALPAANINQGTNTNIVYAVKMDVTVQDVTVNSIQFILSGTYDNTDLSAVAVYFNPTSPVISGASFLGSATANFGGPHTYSIGISKAMPSGTSGYFIITANVTAAATDNHTILINGATNPVVFGYSVSPVLNNTQSNKADPQTIQGADITLTTSAVLAADVNQGTNTNIVYAAKMDVQTEPVNVNSIQFVLDGTYDNTDLSAVAVYFNPTSPVISGASFLGSATANFAAPHTYSIGIFRSMDAATSGYFIITVNVNAAASDNKTIFIDGLAHPVVFGFTTSPNIVNNQANKAKKQTIQGADITLTTSAVLAADVNQGTNTNIVYAAKMDVQTEPVNVNSIQFVLDGTYDNTDLSAVAVYFNPTSPVISGASFLGSATANFAAPHTYSIGIFRSMAAATSGYFIITVNVNAAASDNKTIFIDGLAHPVVFGFTTSPNIVNNQANKAKKQTIQGADITLTTSAVLAADVNQGTNTNIVYAAKMDVQTEPVNVNSIQFVLDGTYDNTDLSAVAVYFNPTSPVISGASFLGSATANFAAPHTYSIGIFRSMDAATSGYFIITVNVNAAASDNKTIFIDGLAHPVVFGFTTSPNIVNNQANKAKKQTIQGADITLTTSAVLAADVNQGTNTNIVYAAKMDVQTEPVNVNSIQFVLDGTYDNTDLSAVAVYFNPTSPVISGASFLGSATANFAAPHTYSIGIFRSMAAATSGYFIITVNVNAAASDNKTIFIDGLAHPVVFGFTTSPNIVNNQANKAKKQTIQGADITLTTPNIVAGNIVRGTNTNIVYAAKMDVQTEPVNVNSIQVTLTGSHDNDDLSAVAVYFNPTSPVISGASFLGSATANFAAPHTYSIGIFRSMAAATSGYFIITVNVSATATTGKTVKINGSTDPVVFGFTTNPNIVNNQSNNAGVKTISATFALSGNNSNNSADANTSERVVSGLYPNPANASFKFSITTEQSGIVKAQLSSRAGTVMQQKNIVTVNGVTQSTFNVSTIPNGVYYLTIFNKEGVQIAKQQVVVQH